MIKIAYCNNNIQVADMFMKALPFAKFDYLRNILEVVNFCIKMGKY